MHPLEILVLPNIARRIPPLADKVGFVMDFLAIWIVTLLLLSYSFIVFLMEGPFILLLFVVLILSIFL